MLTLMTGYLPFLGYHHVLMILIVLAIILLCTFLSLILVSSTSTSMLTRRTALLLAGCSSSSPLIPGIFLLSLYYERYTATPSTAQVDYNVNNAIANIVGPAASAGIFCHGEIGPAGNGTFVHGNTISVGFLV